MVDNQITRILIKTEKIWQKYDAWSTYVGAMRMLLNRATNSYQERLGSNGLPIELLPGLCCEAAGGKFEWTLETTAAWFSLVQAANYIDKVQDNDTLEIEELNLSPAEVLNAATGLIITASALIFELGPNLEDTNLGQRIAEEIFTKLTLATSGQQLELSSENLDLELWWTIAAAKSGSVFETGCRIGAMQGSNDESVIEGLGNFGHNLGLLIQIMDDVTDTFRSPTDASVPSQISQRSLPVIYALEVLSKSDKDALIDLLVGGSSDSHRQIETMKLIHKSGASLYLSSIIDNRQIEACEAIENAVQPSSARAKLRNFVTTLTNPDVYSS